MTRPFTRFDRSHTVWISFVFLLTVMLVSGTAYGSTATQLEITEAEFRLLPTYCPDTQGFTIYGDAYGGASPRAQHWVSLMGPTFWHMHHYCIARLHMLRAQKAGISKNQRDGLLGSVQGNCQYVINAATTGFIMLPEVFTLRGNALLQLGQTQKAGEAFARARESKLDYWPAYSHWAEYLIKKGDRAEALRVVTNGLRYAPQAKVLLEQYRLLGGKPSELPKPVTRDATDTASADKTEQKQ